MRIRAGFNITYDCPAPTPMLLTLNLHSSRRADLVTPDDLRIDPPISVHQYVDCFGNLCSRILAPAGRTRISSDFLVEDDGLPDDIAPDAPQMRVEELPDEALVYLLGSRYCETDRLSDFAWSKFGEIQGGWARVQAIVDYVHGRIGFNYMDARPTKTAWDAHEESAGVCRDYAHLAVTLCRCMNIPARYCTGYIPDIGVPLDPAPMDFCAWFDVYLGGRWYVFDARHNKRRIGRILMAQGRDAADVALANTFGTANLIGFEVIAEEADPTPSTLLETQAAATGA